MDDHALLREYTEHGSEQAFATLVARHINRVYSAALRHTCNPSQAEEIAQTVFVLLAKNCRHLGERVILEGWLYQTARLTALSFVRGELRRSWREQEAFMQSEIERNGNESEVWAQIAPLLDTAMAALNEADRHAVVLRYFYSKSMKDIGEALGANENAATVRLHRALEKMRRFFVQHGVRSTTTVIAAAISANSVQAAPVALAKSITAVVFAKGVATGGSTLLVTQAAAKTATWLKTATFGVILANVFLSQKLVATHFDLAGNPNGWMTGSNNALYWLLFGCGVPLFILASGYLLRFLPLDYLNLPNRDYWLAPERRGQVFDCFFRQFVWLACIITLFGFAILLLEIQANQRTPPHFSTWLAFGVAGVFVVALIIWQTAMRRHFKRFSLVK